MELVTVTFDRVFDVVSVGRPPRTEFGFQAGSLVKYAVPAPGAPAVAAGMTVTAVLRRPGDWQSLLGWVDHASLEISAASVAHPLIWLAGSAVLAAHAWDARVRYQPISAVLAVVALVAVSLGATRMHDAWVTRRLLRATRRRLRALNSSGHVPPPPGH
jgi:hypothetical protein